MPLARTCICCMFVVVEYMLQDVLLSENCAPPQLFRTLVVRRIRCEEGIQRIDAQLGLLHEVINTKVESKMASVRASLKASVQEMGPSVASTTVTRAKVSRAARDD